MHYIEAPHTYNGSEPGLFLAGGITGCPDWQKEMVEQLQDTPLVLYNPRRARFPGAGIDVAHEQIEWEYRHLRKAAAISFWFPCETLNPIVLYELGAWSMTDKPLFIGAHSAYQRIHDVQIQTKLARPDVPIVSSIDELVQGILAWIKGGISPGVSPSLASASLEFPKPGWP